MSLRVGIAGCGAHALGRIVPLLAAGGPLELAAAWTRNANTQAVLRERGVAHVTGDLAQFLAADLDVVYVASPTGCHFEHAAAALRAGRHAWVEKPLCATLAQARELVALAGQQQRMLAEAFMFTWHAQAAALQQALGSAAIGAPRIVSLTFCFPHLPADNVRYDPALGGGAWLDHACYLVKALHLYFPEAWPGDWQLLGGCLEQDGYAVDVRGAAQLRRASDGMVANLNWGFGHNYVNELAVVGTRGSLRAESAFTKPASRGCDLTLEDGQGQRSTIAVPPGNPFARMLAGLAQQLAQPACWPGLRAELLAHAERFFALHAQLQQVQQKHSPLHPPG